MKKLMCLLLTLLLPAAALAEGLESVLPLQITRQGEDIVQFIPKETIAQREPTREEMAVVSAADMGITVDAPSAGVTYRNEYEFAPHETLGFNVHEVSRFSKYDGDALLWTAEIRDYWVRGWQEVREGVLLWGYTDSSLDYYGWPATAWMTLLSHEGAVLWSQPLSPRVGWERTEAVIDRGDGVYTAFSSYFSENREVLCVRQIGTDGQLLSLVETPATALGLTGERPRFYICEALTLDEGYLLHLASGTLHFLAQMSEDGALRQVISYDGADDAVRSLIGTQDSYLTLTHTLYAGGSLWLSGYLTPGSANADYLQSNRDEISGVLASALARYRGIPIDIDWLNLHFSIGGRPVTSEYLVPRIRQCYTAVLLCIDPETFLPRQAYTVDGCLGGALAAADGGITWDVESVTACFFSPFTSYFTIGGTARVFRYVFAADGAFTSGGETEEFAAYRR